MKYRREIDGLRALAVIPVILFNAGFETFRGGFVGVDVFFVISGYLITSILFSEMQTGTFTLAGFYERRARRILPALFVVLFACLPFAWLWLLPSDMKDFSQSLAAVSVFASNFFFWHASGYFETSAALKPLLHTWSLAVEEQYYLLFPAFLLLAWRFGRAWLVAMIVAATIASLAVTQWGAHTHSAFTFYLLPARGWELLLGALVAMYIAGRQRPVGNPALNEWAGALGLFLIAAATVFFEKNIWLPSLYALVPTLGAVLVILFATPQTLVGKLLGNKLLVGIGLISYSAYLWHQPLFSLARHRSLDEPGKWLMAALSITTLLLAFLSWKYVETPFRDRKRVSRKQILVLAAAGSVSLACFGLAGHFTDGWFFHAYDPVISVIEQTRSEIGKNRPCWARLTKSGDLSNACEIGAPVAKKSFALVGDSHAGALVAELDLAARKAGIGGLDYTYSTCLPLSGGQAENHDVTQEACETIRQDFFRKLQNNELPETLVLAGRWTLWLEQDRFDNTEGGVETGYRVTWNAPGVPDLGYVRALQKSYMDSITRMLTAGHKVILVYPIPEMGWDVPVRLGKIRMSGQAFSANAVSTSHAVFSARNARAYAALDAIGKLPNLSRVKPETIFCNTFVKARCVAQLDGTPLYYDDDHLSNAGARRVVDNIMLQIKNGADNSGAPVTAQ